MQLEFFDVPSPFVGICQSNDKGQCIGCFRTREERLNWTSLDVDAKQKVIKRCQQRKKRSEAVPKKVKPEVETSADLQPSLLDPPTKPALENSDDLDFADFEL